MRGYLSSPDDTSVITTTLLFSVMSIQVFLWIGSRATGWRLVWGAETTGVESGCGGQFSIKQLFLGVSLLAATMALARVVFANGKWDLGEAIPGIVFGPLAALPIAVNLLPTLAGLRTAYHRKPQTVEYVFFFLMVVVGTSFVEILIFPLEEEIGRLVLLLLAINAIQCVIVGGVMLLLQRVGVVWADGNAKRLVAATADPIDTQDEPAA